MHQHAQSIIKHRDQDSIAIAESINNLQLQVVNIKIHVTSIEQCCVWWPFSVWW